MSSIIVFPGQGSQYVGMCKKLIGMPKVQQMFEYASDLFKTDLLRLCIDGPKTDLDKTRLCQPAVFVASMAALELLKETKPHAVSDCYATAGFSVGEYSALCLAGAITFEDALRVIQVRAEEMQRASELVPSGLMAAFLSRQSKLSLAMLASRKWCTEKLKLDEETVVCQVSNYLNVKCKVVGGNKEALDFLQLNYKEFGILKLKSLPVSGAFHTSLMKSAESPLKAILKEIQVKKPVIDVYSNYDAKSRANPDQIKYMLTKQVSSPVKWEQTLNEFYYDKNLPMSPKAPGIDQDSEESGHGKIAQNQDRMYPDIYECGPSPHTGPILRTINHKAYRFYKFIGV